MGKQNEDYKAEYVDIHGKRHIVTAEEAFAVNGYNDPPGGYYCPYCKIPMVLCHRNNHWYFRTNPPRLDKRAQEDAETEPGSIRQRHLPQGTFHGIGSI